MSLKSIIKRTLLHFGYSIQRIQTTDDNYVPGNDPFEDIRRLTSSRSPIVFDVGANTGQTVEAFRKYFKNPVIYSFEPGEEAFRTLTENTRGLSDVHIINNGLGARQETRMFMENELSDMSSFYEPGENAWGSITQRRPLHLDTVDDYCSRVGIEHINILKTDTQGYDLEVLRGAGKMLRDKRIDLIYLELSFSEMYRGSPRFDEVYAFLADHGMTIVSFYKMYYQNAFLSWTDGLFADAKTLSRFRSVVKPARATSRPA